MSASLDRQLAAMMKKLGECAKIEQGFWLDGLDVDDFRPELVWCQRHGRRAARLLTRLVFGPSEDHHWDRPSRWDESACWSGDDDVQRCHFCGVALDTGGILDTDSWWEDIVGEEYAPSIDELFLVGGSMLSDSAWWGRWHEAALVALAEGAEVPRG